MSVFIISKFVLILLYYRLKNSESLLYKSMENYNTLCHVLLTGTPVQNNLAEMYALLSFVVPNQFTLADKDDFLETYRDVKTDSNGWCFSVCQ